MDRVGALGSWGSGMGRGYGNVRGGGVRGTEGGGETDGPGEMGGRFLIVFLPLVPATFQGCVEKIGVWLRRNILVVAAAALGIAFVEVRGALWTHSKASGK